MEWIKGVVISNQLAGEKFRWIKIKPEKEIAYGVGQYLFMEIGEGNKRSYSICSVPGSEELELLVDITPGSLPAPDGAGSRYIDELKEGDEVRLAMPFGTFTWREEGTRITVFVGTGSGISSLWPMILEASVEREKTALLFWGLRKRENIFWEERFEDVSMQRLNFATEVVLSEPEADWLGKTGHVTESVAGWLSGFLNGGGGVEEVSFYLCGNGEMIKEVTKLIGEMGVTREHIHSESYFDGGGVIKY